MGHNSNKNTEHNCINLIVRANGKSGTDAVFWAVLGSIAPEKC